MISVSARSPGPGHQILVEVGAAMVAVGIIGLGRLVERVADAHPRAADELLLDHFRVQRAADLEHVLDRQHGDLAGLVVDLDLGHRAGMGVAGRRLHRAGFRLRIGARNEEHAAAGDRAAALEMRGERGVEDRDRLLRRALDHGCCPRRRSRGRRRSTSSSSAATSSITWRASFAAWMTALPMRCVPREAKVPMQCGPVSVSAVSTMTRSVGTPIVSAQICAMICFRPWPRSTLDSVTMKLPVGVEWTSAWRRVAAEVHAGRIVDRGHAASAPDRHLKPPFA